MKSSLIRKKGRGGGKPLSQEESLAVVEEITEYTRTAKVVTEDMEILTLTRPE